MSSIDGIRLDYFLPGRQYEVGNVIGALFLAERWAEPVASDEPAMLIPMHEFDADAPKRELPRLPQEYWPPSSDKVPVSVAADRPRKRRARYP